MIERNMGTPPEDRETGCTNSTPLGSKVNNPPVSNNPKDAFGRMKPGISSIPAVALIHESMAMANGANKYGPYNWRDKTVSCRVYIDAMFRHLLAYLDGETCAGDSGIHHLGHLRASAGIILDAEEQGTMIDDRPKAGKASEVLDRLTKRTGGTVMPGPGQDRIHTSGYLQVEGPVGPKEAPPMLGARRCYIAGPMRGLPKYNFPAFDMARDLAISKGWNPISPADLDRQNGIHEDTQPQSNDLASKAALCREFVDRDSRALISLRAEKGDAIAMLPGWEKSTGAVAEFFLARWLQLACLNAETMEPFTLYDQENMTLASPLVSAAFKFIEGRHR